VVYLLILRPVKKQAMTAFKELPGKLLARNSAAAASTPGAAGSPEGALQIAPEGQRATQLKRMLTDKIKAEPAAASRLVESWVREDQDA
jgi:hypothetical protein